MAPYLACDQVVASQGLVGRDSDALPTLALEIGGQDKRLVLFFDARVLAALFVF
eukprot:m.146107 g.146107  ORF g.146107 m.146107 type:complete len:54 (+) comp17239_c3_seq1:175-336(+)